MSRFAAALAAFLMSAIPAQACGFLEACKPAPRIVKHVKPRPKIDRLKPLVGRVDGLEKRLAQDEVIVRSWVKSIAAAHSRLDTKEGRP
jgi:hypothetical protein